MKTRNLKRIGALGLSVIMCAAMAFSVGCSSPANNPVTKPVQPPYIGSDGYWYVNGEKTDVLASGKDGEDGANGNVGDVYSPSPKIVESKYVSEGVNGNFQHNGKFYMDYTSLGDAQNAGHKLGENIEAEGATLLKNANAALPLRTNERNVTLLGIRTSRMVRSGFGSGSGGGSERYNRLGESLTNAGFSVNPKMQDLYYREVDQMFEDRILELDPDTYGASYISTYSSYNDAAILTFGRSGAENYDLATNNALGHSDPNEHMLQLDDNEVKLVRHAKKYFRKVIVLINSSNIMQVPELAEEKTDDNLGVDAILWVGSVGQDGTKAIASILKGDICPSGHTVDLWEKDFKKSPVWTNFGYNTQNFEEHGNRLDTFYYDKNGNATKFANLEYREGIYSGYKYYETLYADAAEDEKEEAYDNVLYPFGYGLSYTSFEWKLDNVRAKGKIDDPAMSITMRVWVKNTGTVEGKDVVQVYYSAPYTKGGIEKSATNLVGFAKTKLLKPGQSDVVTITFNAQDMASFDWNDANNNGFKGYELEAGDYTISINRNSHDVVDSVTRTVYKTILCKTDLVTGKEIKPVYTGSFDSTNRSLLDNMISRADGLKQPAPASREDRTLSAATLADYESQATYFGYQDKPSDPWYVKDGGLPKGWDQAPAGTTAPTEITLADMAGVPYIEPTIVNGVVTFPEMTDEQKENNAKWDAFMNQLTWSELCYLPTGSNRRIKRVGMGTDSSYGDPDGPINAGGVQFPSNPILAATFNQDMAYEMGRLSGNLLVLNGSKGWRGAGADIHRSPFSGRNFEYYSEDGVMSGLIGAQVAKGVTEKGIMAHFKHCFGNDQETYRADYGGVFTWATEQTLREQTAKPFEYIVKYGGTIGLMTAFNRIGKWTQSNNYATHELLLNGEWDFQGATETDAWAKQFVPLNRMVRGGDEELLGSDNNYPDCALERGRWDPVTKCVYIAASAEEYQSYNSGIGTLKSPTHYFAVRKCAQRTLQKLANSVVNGNCVADTEVVNYTLVRGVGNSIKLSIPGKTNDATFSNFSGSWPGGMSFNSSTGMITGVPTGTVGGDVTATYNCDGWITGKKVVFKFNVVSDLLLNGEHIYDDMNVYVAAGEAYNATITADQMKYGAQLYLGSYGQNRRIMNSYRADGRWYHRDEDKSAADIITLGDRVSDPTQDKIYKYEISGLPTGLSATLVETDELGWAGRTTYKVNTVVKISGMADASAKGEHTVTVTLLVPHSGKGTSPWMNAGSDMVRYVQTFKIVVI